MELQRTTLSLLTVLAVICTVHASSFTFTDGNVYKIVSDNDGSVLTVGQRANDGGPVTTTPWNSQLTQEWVSLLAVQSDQSFLLVSKRQPWSWDQFAVSNQGLASHRLLSSTVVLGVDGDSGQVTEQSIGRKSGGKSSQRWRTVPAGKKQVLLMNLRDNLCLQNTGSAILGTNNGNGNVFNNNENSQNNVFGGRNNFNRLTAVPCDRNDFKQKWRLENVI